MSLIYQYLKAACENLIVVIPWQNTWSLRSGYIWLVLVFENANKSAYTLLAGAAAEGVERHVRYWRQRPWRNSSQGQWSQWYATCLCSDLFLLVIRPHHSTTYVDAAYCYRPSSVVCLSHWALQKRLNRSRCRLGWGLGWAQGTMY